MNSKLGGGMIALSTMLLLSVTSLASAQTPSRTIDNSRILPYLLDNSNDNSLMRVHCVSKDHKQVNKRRRISRDHLLTPNVDAVTIEIEGSCQNVRIRVQDDSDFADYPAYNPHLDDNDIPFDDSSWLTREGSGWYWLLHRR
ncbi:hypothetical protein NIES4103_12400 [Nostoc sp. NIES-4103]|nr:hypothetical protein NIES4103_12400 [Nostoc sp. NIES-4103]